MCYWALLFSLIFTSASSCGCTLILNLNRIWSSPSFNIKTQSHFPIPFTLWLKSVLLPCLSSNGLFIHLSTQSWVYSIIFYKFEDLDSMKPIVKKNNLIILNSPFCFPFSNYLAKNSRHRLTKISILHLLKHSDGLMKKK